MFLNRNMFPEINMVFYTPERHKLPSLCVKCMHHKFSALGTIIYLPSLKLMSILKGIPYQAKKEKILPLSLYGKISTNGTHITEILYVPWKINAQLKTYSSRQLGSLLEVQNSVDSKTL